MNIPLARPWFDETDELAMLEALRSGWVGQGPRVAGFEQAFAAYAGVPWATAVSSCTAALHLALLAAGIGPGHEVLVPAFTWVSTPNAAEYVGARPVFCDVDPLTLNVDPEALRRSLSPRTRAIMVVHMFGLAADMQAVLELARSRELLVVEDAACALGTTVLGRSAGTLGDVGCFSFHPRKSITTGEGGMLVALDRRLEPLFRSLRDIGSAPESLSPEGVALNLMADFPRLGFNLRLTDLQAALGLSQLKKFDEILLRRRNLAQLYTARIENSPLRAWLRPPPANQGGSHAYQAYVCMLETVDDSLQDIEEPHVRRNRLMGLLKAEGIGTRPGTHAPHALGYYRDKYGLAPADYPNAWRAACLSLALPLYAQMTADELGRVCDRLEALWGQTR